jgi:DNA-binding NtrC family response regulator
MSHVLVVEDDPTVVPTLCAMLEYHGHSCSFTGNGADALATLDGGGIDVVLTDVRLPGRISGIEIADRAQAVGVGCVLITGYGDIMSELERGQHWIWLSKPFRGSALAEAVEAARRSAHGRWRL